MSVRVEKRGDSRFLTFTTPLAPQAVYDYLSDFNRHCEWTEEILSMEKSSDGPLAVGTEYKTTEAMRPGSRMKAPTSCEVTVLDPPRRIEWRARTSAARGPMAMRSRWAFEIAPEGSGSRVTQSYAMEPQNIWAKGFLKVFTTLADGLMGGAGASPKNVKKHAENLERVLNARAGSEGEGSQASSPAT